MRLPPARTQASRPGGLVFPGILSIFMRAESAERERGCSFRRRSHPKKPGITGCCSPNLLFQFFFEPEKNICSEFIFNKQARTPPRSMSALEQATAGALGSAAALSLLYPLDVAKVRVTARATGLYAIWLVVRGLGVLPQEGSPAGFQRFNLVAPHHRPGFRHRASSREGNPRMPPLPVSDLDPFRCLTIQHLAHAESV